MDKTILSLITILVSGMGIIGSFITYEPPELNATYFGFNPFAYKKAAIDKVIKRTFACLAFSGLAIQVYPLFVADLSDQKYTLGCYLSYFALGILVMVGLGLLINKLCISCARKSWFPELRIRMREVYESSLFIIENDGWRPDQLQTKESLANPEMYRIANFEAADSRIAILQKVFDIPDVLGDRRMKIAHLRKIFEQGV